MQKIGTLIISLLMANAINAQVFDWAKGFGGTESERGESITMDEDGNVYSAGFFSGTADFDPGAGVEERTSVAASTDCYVQKLDDDGNLLWVHAIGGPDFDFINAISIDSLDNVYVFGFFYGTVDFDPTAGDASVTSTGSQDCFLVKFDTDGNFV